MNAMNDLATLRTQIARTRDKDGYYSRSTTSDLDVYCKIKSATRSEVYEALRSGVSVKIMALVYADDYRAACVTVNGSVHGDCRQDFEPKPDRIQTSGGKAVLPLQIKKGVFL